jgi:lysophospholipase L1-like esterase
MKRLAAVFGLFVAAMMSTLPLTSRAGAQEAKSSLMFVIDTSGSMDSAAQGGLTRIQSARKALNEVVLGLDGSANVGLRSFAGGCGPGRLLVPVGPLDKAVFKTNVDGLSSAGLTPIDAVLRASIKDLPLTGKRTIVLLSDGEETCGGSPCLAVKEILKSGISVTINTIGFATSGTGAEPELQCIATASGGKYFPVESASSLAAALIETSKPVTETPKVVVVVPVTAAPTTTTTTTSTTTTTTTTTMVLPLYKTLKNFIAVGDSYSSGEGSTGVPNKQYEAESTLFPFRCHRSLAAYHKLIKGAMPQANYQNGTCSGATIDRYPNTRASADVVKEQLQLVGGGRNADLVTASMGGNDAQFGSIIGSCIGSWALRKFLDNYQIKPLDARAVGGIASSLSDEGLGCKALAELAFNVDDAVAKLEGRVTSGFTSLTQEAPNALILGLNYPNPVPPIIQGASCSGILAQDAKYLDALINNINAIETRAQTAVSGVVPVDVSTAFRNHELCSSNPFINGLANADLDKLYNQISALANPEVDKLADRWGEVRNCFLLRAAATPVPFVDGCSDATYTTLKNALKAQAAVIAALPNTKAFILIVETFVVPDQRNNLFHPSDQGHKQMACIVSPAIQLTLPCADPNSLQAPNIPPPNPNKKSITIGAKDVTVGYGGTDIRINPSVEFSVDSSGWFPSFDVKINIFSEPVTLGTLKADATGRIDGFLRLPANFPPGHHRLVLEGSAPDGSQQSYERIVFVPGDPKFGDDFGTYVQGFSPGEEVTVTYGRETFRYHADSSGGVLFSAPAVDSNMVFVAKSVGTRTVASKLSVNGVSAAVAAPPARSSSPEVASTSAQPATSTSDPTPTSTAVATSTSTSVASGSGAQSTSVPAVAPAPAQAISVEPRFAG